MLPNAAATGESVVAARIQNGAAERFEVAATSEPSPRPIAHVSAESESRVPSRVDGVPINKATDSGVDAELSLAASRGEAQSSEEARSDEQRACPI